MESLIGLKTESKVESKHEIAKPITNLPTTVSKALDLRNRVENRITSLHEAHSKKNPFWNVGTNSVPAMEIVQSILDRHHVLSELNEIISAMSVMKNSGVTVPQFLPGTFSYNLTLGQLRDSENWLLPHLEAINAAITEQMNSVASACIEHDARVEHDLKAELSQLEVVFKEKTELAKRYGDKLPDKDDLEEDKETAIRRAETKRSIKIDSVGVKKLLMTIRPFIILLKERRNDKIDACNAQDITKELLQFNKIKLSAYDALRFEKNVSEVDMIPFTSLQINETKEKMFKI